MIILENKPGLSSYFRVCCCYPIEKGKVMKVNYKLIGLRIKENRQLRNMTQEELAELSEITPGYISLLETGRKKPSLGTLLSISKAFNITINELLLGNQILLDTDYNREISDLMSKCNEDERRLMFEIMRTVHDVLIQNRTNQE